MKKRVEVGGGNTQGLGIMFRKRVHSLTLYSYLNDYIVIFSPGAKD